MKGPLAGLRVLDLSRLLPGPFLTSVLAELGADIVKVEAPGIGDETRLMPYAFDAVNQGKRSIVLDLKSAEGPSVLLRLAARSDVLVESFRPGVMDRLGLGDALLAATNPRLVRCSLVGYQEGEHRDEVGHDLNYQALSGALALTPDPVVPVSQTADLGGALYGATGILAALWDRERTGRGARIEVALAQAAIAFQTLPLARERAGETGAGGWELTGRAPCYRLYRCADAKLVAFAALEPRFFTRFCALTGVDEALQFDDSRKAHATLEALFASKPADEWVTSLGKAGVPITHVLSPSQVEASSSPGSPLARVTLPAAPALGEHAKEILLEVGFTPAEISVLREAGTFGAEP